MTGRPSSYSPETALAICLEVAEGKSLNTICKQEGYPALRTVMQWLDKEDYKDFTQMYTRARESQADYYADEIMDLADNCDPMDVNKVKLQIESRKWIAAKLKPRKYGDSTTIKGDKDNPIALSLAVALEERIAKRLTDRTREVIEGEAVDVTDG
jgi:hypothetical protein